MALSPAVEGVPESVLKTILGANLGDDSEVFHSYWRVPQEFKKYMIDVDYTREEFEEKFPEARTFPQITMDGEYIGGFTELDAHLG